MPSRLRSTASLPTWLVSLSVGLSVIPLAACDISSGASGDGSWLGRVIVSGRSGGIGAQFHPLPTEASSAPIGSPPTSMRTDLLTYGKACAPTCLNRYLLEDSNQKPFKFYSDESIGSIKEYDNNGCTVAALSALRFKLTDFHDSNDPKLIPRYAETTMEDTPEEKCAIIVTVSLWNTDISTKIPDGITLNVNNENIPIAASAPTYPLKIVSKSTPMRLKLNLPLGWEFVGWRMSKPNGQPYSVCDGLDVCSFHGFGGTISAAIAPSGECDQTVGEKAQICREITSRGIRGLWGPTQRQEYWAVGRNRTIVHMKNGIEIADNHTDTLGPVTLRSVWGYTSQGRIKLVAVGEEGSVLHFDGQNWVAEVSTTSEPLFAVSGNPEGSVIFAVGANGTIVRRFPGNPVTLEPAKWQRETADILKGVNFYTVIVAQDGRQAYAGGDNGSLFCHRCVDPSKDEWTLLPYNPDRRDVFGTRELRGAWLGNKGLWILAAPATSEGLTSTLFLLTVPIPGMGTPRAVDISFRASSLWGITAGNEDHVFVVGQQSIFTYATGVTPTSKRWSMPSNFLRPASSQFWTVFTVEPNGSTLFGGDSGVLRAVLPVANLRATPSATESAFQLIPDWPAR